MTHNLLSCFYINLFTSLPFFTNVSLCGLQAGSPRTQKLTLKDQSSLPVQRRLLYFVWSSRTIAFITSEAAYKKNTSHGNEVLPQDTTHLIQRPCYQRRSPCQVPAGDWTTRRPDHRKETQTAVVWSWLPFIRSGQNYIAMNSERGKKTRQTEEEVGRQHQEMDSPGVRKVPEGSGEQGKLEETGCEIICGAPTTLAVKG